MAETQSGWGWFVVAAGFIINTFTFSTYKCLGIFFVEFNEVFQSSATASSGMYTIIQGTMFCIAPIAFPLMERVGHRRVMMVGSIAGALGFFLTSFAPNMTFVLFVFGILFGICFGSLYAVGNLMVTKYFADHPRKGLANGITCAGGSVGVLTLPMLTRYIISTYGLRGALQVYAGCQLQLCVATAVCRPVEKNTHSYEKNRPRTSNDTKTVKHDFRHGSFLESMWASFPFCNSKLHDVEPLFHFRLLKNHTLILILVGHAMMYGGYVCCFLYFPPYGVQIGMSKLDTALIMTIGGVCDLVFRVTTGWVIDLPMMKLKARNIMALNGMVGGLVAIFMPLFTTRGLRIFYIVILSSSLAGMGISVFMAIAESVADDEITHVFAILTMVVTISLGSLPPLIGYVKDLTGDYNIAFQLCGALMITGSILVFSLSCVELFCRGTRRQNCEHRLSQQSSL